MLVEMAIGDGYGAGFEFVDPKVVAKTNDLKGYHQHPKWSGLKPGFYTDDTQMCLALTELMLRKDPSGWTPLDVASAFVKMFKADPRHGYAGQFYQFMMNTKTGADFIANITPHSTKSGGAMRAPIIGLLPDPAQVVDVAMFQASLTHATRIGMNSAAAAALLTHYFWYRKGPKAEVGSFINQWVSGRDWSVPYHGKVGHTGWMHVQSAITCIVENDTLSDVLHAVVARTGDVDTSAAIAMAAASVCDEVKPNLPNALYDGLEGGPFGMTLLRRGDMLMTKKYPRPEPRKGRPLDEDTCGGHMIFEEEKPVDFDWLT